MIARGSGGAIVNVSSQASMIALKDHTLYCKPIYFFLFSYLFFQFEIFLDLAFIFTVDQLSVTACYSHSNSENCIFSMITLGMLAIETMDSAARIQFCRCLQLIRQSSDIVIVASTEW